jgi:hypothetical protein
MMEQGQRSRRSRWRHDHPGRPGEPDTGQRGLYTRGFRDAESDSNRLSKRTSERSDMVGAPDARKRACPVRGALDGNLLRERNKAPPFDSMLCHDQRSSTTMTETTSCRSPPLDPCVRLSSHTAHERGTFTGNFHFTNSTDFTVVSLRIRWLPLSRCPHPPPQGLGHVRGFPAFRLLCPI